jgi:ferritin-like metal-binding protein YciE
MSLARFVSERAYLRSGYGKRMSNTSTTTPSSLGYDSAANGGDEKHSLQTYVSDLLALTKHIEVPIVRQLNSDDSADFGEALTIIRDMKSTMAAQRTALESRLENLGGHPAAGIKSAWSTLLGAGAAAIGSVRKTKVSKNLRDDYTALGLASISYTMLHATAMGLGDEITATLAQRHLEQTAALVVRISKAIPAVVLQELRDDGEAVRVNAADVSAKLTHEAWQQSS